MRSNIVLTFIPAVGYVLLSTGTLLPVEALGPGAILYACVAVGLIAAIANSVGPRISRHVLSIILIVIAPIAITFCLSSVRALDVAMTLRRLEGGLLISAMTSFLIAIHVLIRGEHGFQKALVHVAAVVLVATVIYKYKVSGDFFDRDDGRFLLNGPIVFGWIMGFACLTILHCVIREGLPLRYLYLAVIFLLALLWTQSRGPLVALAVMLTAVLAAGLKLRRARLIIGGLAVLSVALYFFVPIEFFSRLLLILELFFSDTTVISASTDVRAAAWIDAQKMFVNNPLVGVGVSNWQFSSDYGWLQYPHSVLLEVAAEGGVIGVLAVVGTLAFVFRMSTTWGRLVLCYFVICCSFSGDFSYFRFILSIPLGLLVARDPRSRRLRDLMFRPT